MIKDGRDMATATRRAEGKIVDPGKIRYIGAIFYETRSENKLAFLNHIIGMNEYEVDALGNYEHRLWEWK